MKIFSRLKIQSASAIETTTRSKGRQRSIHLIRFGSTDNLTNKTVTVDYELPKGHSAKEVSVWSPDLPADAVLFSWKAMGDRLQVSISRVENYALVGVTLK